MKPPLIARALLLAVAGEACAECVAGDLEEECQPPGFRPVGRRKRLPHWPSSLSLARLMQPLITAAAEKKMVGDVARLKSLVDGKASAAS
jgi:hypothetical protein